MMGFLIVSLGCLFHICVSLRTLAHKATVVIYRANMQDSDVVTVIGQTTAQDLLDLWKGSRLRYLGWLLILVGIFYAYLAFAEIVNEGFHVQTPVTLILHSLSVFLAFTVPLFPPPSRT